MTATVAKNEFGRLLEKVIRGNVLFITRHGAAKAVLMPMEEYDSLTQAGAAKLHALTAEFDALLQAMQTPKARSAMRKAFAASPKQMGRAARAAARTHD